MEACKISNMYTLSETIAAGLFEGAEYPWEVLPKIHDFILEQVRYDKLKKPYSHEILGPLTQGVGVWAKAFLRTNLKKEARISGLQNLQRLLPQPA